VSEQRDHQRDGYLLGGFAGVEPRKRCASADGIQPWSDRKHRMNAPAPWTSEEIVKAQCMACEGIDLLDIAERLGRDIIEVLRVVEQDQPTAAKKRRQTTYARSKARL
jgi:hypothetical protein